VLRAGRGIQRNGMRLVESAGVGFDCKFHGVESKMPSHILICRRR